MFPPQIRTTPTFLRYSDAGLVCLDAVFGAVWTTRDFPGGESRCLVLAAAGFSEPIALPEDGPYAKPIWDALLALSVGGPAR